LGKTGGSKTRAHVKLHLPSFLKSIVYFSFTCSYYIIIENVEPENFDEVKKLIAKSHDTIRDRVEGDGFITYRLSGGRCFCRSQSIYVDFQCPSRIKKEVLGK
jgi:hypothetical protein